MPHEFVAYVEAIADHWLFWFGGIVLLILELAKHIPNWKRRAEKCYASQMFWVIALVCVFIATFQAWHDEYTKNQVNVTYLSESMSATYAPASLPINYPLSFNVHWKDAGNFPASIIIGFGRMYIRDDASIATQASVIASFKKSFEEVVKDTQPRSERPMLFPNQPSDYWFTAEGPVLLKNEADEFYAGHGALFLLGAVRFTDGAGTHESHVCRMIYKPNPIRNSPDMSYTVSWGDCYDYVSQIDVH